MNPKVSVIIPNYNYSQYIGEAVESVLSQTYANVEIIVVDDGSKDNSLEVLQSFGNKIKVIKQQNAGVSVARNNGVANSDGEFIAFLDADDIWFPEKIEKQVKAFSENTKLGLVHVGVQDIDAKSNNLDIHLDGLSGEISHEFLLLNRAVVLGGGSGAMITRKTFDEVGGFDTRLSTSADWDLYYQVSSRYPIEFIAEVLLKYRIHGTNMHGNVKAMEDDVLISFEKAFSKNSDDLQQIRQECYGNFYMTLAGSYYRAKNYSKFLEMTRKSLLTNPKKITYFFGYPIRMLKKIVT